MEGTYRVERTFELGAEDGGSKDQPLVLRRRAMYGFREEGMSR